MAKERKPSDTVQLKLRFPEALRRRLEREAKKHGASLNAEIIRTLNDAFRESDKIQGRALAIAEAVAERLGDQIISEIEGAIRRAEQSEEDRIKHMEEMAARFGAEAKEAREQYEQRRRDK